MQRQIWTACSPDLSSNVSVANHGEKSQPMVTWYFWTSGKLACTYTFFSRIEYFKEFLESVLTLGDL